MIYDGSNRKDIRRAEKLAKQADAARISVTRTIMSDPQGRQWMHNLLGKCNVFHTPFVRGASDITSFNCGAQNIGLQLFADVVAHCPTQYVQMMNEASQKELANERRDSNERSTSGESAGSEDPRRDDEGSVAGEYDPLERAGEET